MLAFFARPAENEMNGERFSRTEKLLGTAAMDRLARARVAVFGLGGVGGYVVEALARSGVGALDLVDADVVDVTNINRQILALSGTVGEKKALVAKARVAEINPDCSVNAVVAFVDRDNIGAFDMAKYDFVVDAVDTVTAKIAVVEAANRAGTRIISCMGTAKKTDPSRLKVIDLFATDTDPLARVMRRELRKRGITSLPVVCSDEPPLPCQDEGKAYGSVAFVPSVAGLLAAAFVVRSIAGERPSLDK